MGSIQKNIAVRIDQVARNMVASGELPVVAEPFDASPLLRRIEALERRSLAPAQPGPAPSVAPDPALLARIEYLERNDQTLAQMIADVSAVRHREILQELHIMAAADYAPATAMMAQIAAARGIPVEQLHIEIQRQRDIDIAAAVAHETPTS